MTPSKIVPWVAFVLALGLAAVGMLPRKQVRGMDLDAFDRLPVLDGGRVKPIDSVARNTLLLIRSQQSFRFPADSSWFRRDGRTVQADEWLLDAMLRPEVSDAQPIFVINDPDILGLLGLKQTSDRYFSFKTLSPHLGELEKQGQQARSVEAKQRTRFQNAIVNLYDRLLLFYRLKNTLKLAGGAWLEAEIEGRNGPGAVERQQRLVELASFRPLLPPPEKPDDWRSIGEALVAARTGPLHPGLEPYARLAAAYEAQDAAGFNAAVTDLRTLTAQRFPDALRQGNHEALFSRAQPFYVGMVIYVLALLALFVSWLWKPKILQPTSFALLCAGVLVHTGGLVSRIVLQGRPPVTNLYSSAVFVGWAAVVVGVILERMYRRGFGTAVASAAGFCSLLIAHHLAGDGDTMEMMRAVLDSNFWLATHVVTITIGYSGTFLAGAIAIAYTVRRHVAPRIESGTTKVLVSMTYGVICFALFFSFVGTVLGGIWADQSWGRFWGWDPKENGALLIVLWNGIILHARLGGFVREKGLMAMAIFGNVITSLSWFGVNMLGVGLHSYGFMDSAFVALSAFIISQAILMTFCLLPRRFWKGSQSSAELEVRPEPRPPPQTVVTP